MSQKQNDDQFSDKLGNILSDPEMMQKIIQMAAALKQNEEGRSTADSGHEPETEQSYHDDDTSDEEQAAEEETPAISVSVPPLPLLPHSSGPHHRDANTELLRALRPYLSSRRQEKIDKLLKVMKLTEMTESMKRYL